MFWWAIKFSLLGAPIYLPQLLRACMWARTKISKTLVPLTCPIVLLKGARSSCWNSWRHRGSCLAAIWAADRLCADQHHHHHRHHNNNKIITTITKNKNTNTATATTIKTQTTDSITSLWPKILATLQTPTVNWSAHNNTTESNPTGLLQLHDHNYSKITHI